MVFIFNAPPQEPIRYEFIQTSRNISACPTKPNDRHAQNIQTMRRSEALAASNYNKKNK